MNKDLKFLSPFKRMCITIGNLPTAYIESMSYYECLTFLVNYLANTVIPTVNNNSDVVKELQDKFAELTAYVDNYFNNLDVQEEINNKLDDMAEQGELATIILDYLQMSGLMMYDTLVDMKGTDHVIDGSYLEIAGTLTYDDGHRALYRVREKLPTDVIDEVELVSLSNYPDLVAEKLKDYRLDEIEDDITNIGNDISNINDDITAVQNSIGDLGDLDTTDKSSIVNAINESLDYADTKMSEFLGYKDQFYYYVDGTNGSDDNDGLTSLTAFATIDKFLETINTKSTDARCHIISNGIYKFGKTNFFNANIHIIGDTNDITLTSDLTELVFYGGHINIRGIKWNMPNNYFDNVLVTVNQCTLISPMRIYGGAINMSDSTINQLRLSWTKAVLDDVVIDGQDKTNNAIHCDSSTDLTIFDNLTISSLANQTSYGVIGAYRATIYFICTVIDNSNGEYNNGIICNHHVILVRWYSRK